jgi:hypothetical protein
MPSENEGKRNPLVRQRAYVQGLASAPSWETVGMLAGFSDGEVSMAGSCSRRRRPPTRSRSLCSQSAKLTTRGWSAAKCGSSQPTCRS